MSQNEHDGTSAIIPREVKTLKRHVAKSGKPYVSYRSGVLYIAIPPENQLGGVYCIPRQSPDLINGADLNNIESVIAKILSTPGLSIHHFHPIEPIKVYRT